MSIHENVKFSCNQCESKFTHNGQLKIHILSVHENVKYPCDQCDYKATTKGSLTTHKIARHKNIKYKKQQQKTIWKPKHVST